MSFSFLFFVLSFLKYLARLRYFSTFSSFLNDTNLYVIFGILSTSGTVSFDPFPYSEELLSDFSLGKSD